MIIKKKRKEVHEEPVQKKKKVKSSRSQAIIKIEKDVPTVIKSEDDDQLESKTKVRKKENLKDDECLDQLELKKKKKNKKKKVSSELLKEAHLESFVKVGGHLDSEPQEESEEQIKIIKKKKKKVQCYSSLSSENNQSSDVELSNHHTNGTKENQFPFRKSRKNTALNLGFDGEVTKEKKKGIFSFSLEDIQDSEHKQSEKVRKNPQKYISQEKAFRGKPHGTDIIQNDGESYMRRKKRKKKKYKSNSFLPLADNQDNIYGVPDSPVALNDFRKRQRKNSQEITLTNRKEENATENSGSIRQTKRKKRKSKDMSSLTWEDNQDDSHRVPDKHLPAQQEVEPEDKEISGKKSRKNIKDNNEVTKKKKKKKIQKEEEETTYSKVSLNNDSASKSQKITLLESKKKNKESEMQRAECVTGDVADRVLCNTNHMVCDRKRQKRKKEIPEDFAEEPGSKANTEKKKIKREDMGNEALEHVDDVTIVQEKKGNCDEVNIDKVRRQALQEEIDRESGKTKVINPKVEWDTKLGQWSTAAFQSSEEEMKFFRLMGVFKKGSVPIQNLSATANKPNMALNREGEEKLQQALKREFDKAMDLKQHRGIGLGFQLAANKKVYIDKYASRSTKLED